MIEPHSAQEGASAWEVKVTWPRPMPRLPSVLRVPLLLPLPLTSAADAIGRSLAGGGVGVEASGAATAVGTLGGEACPATPGEPLPEVPAPPETPAGLPNPRFRGWIEDSAVTDRSTRPSVARSSGGRKREPSQRKM